MEILNLIFNAENIRTAIIIIAILYISKSQELKIEKRFVDFEKRFVDFKVEIIKTIDEKLITFHTILKDNDFAHLNRTIKALTFTLEKNKILDAEDKKYVDSYLDEK
jgi:hypothetical protein